MSRDEGQWPEGRAGDGDGVQGSQGRAEAPDARASAGSRRIGRKGWVLGGVASAALVAVIATVTVTGGGSTPALVAWTPTAAQADPAKVTALVADCEARLADWFAAAGQPAPQRVVVTEKRGEFTAVVLDSPDSADSYGACMQPADGPLIAGAGGKPGRWPSSKVNIIHGPGLVNHETGVASIFGRAELGVATVTVTTFGGQRVAATVANGWYFAWWPIDWGQLDHSGAQTLTVTDGDGRDIEVVDAQSAPTEPPPAG